MMDKRIIGFCIALLCVFSFGYMSGASSETESFGTIAQIRAISDRADDMSEELPAFKKLSERLTKIEESLPEFATKADIEKAVADARDAISEEIEYSIKAAEVASDTSRSVSFKQEADLATVNLAIDDLRSRVKKLEDTIEQTSKLSATQAGTSGGSSGKAIVSGVQGVAAPVVTFETVSSSVSNGCWGSTVEFAPAETRTVRVIEPRQPRTVSTVAIPAAAPEIYGVSYGGYGGAFGVSASDGCYIDPATGQQVCPSVSAGVTTSTRRGLFGLRRR